MSSPGPPRAVAAYIATFPPEIQEILQKIRTTIRKAAPEAEEKISYRMPAFTYAGRILIHYAAFKHHIGLYPPVRGDANLMAAVAPYAGEKGNLRFPLDEEIPFALIRRIVQVRMNRRREQAR
jgi:uncharacterized protein YdhG (YjbR/CyaY superfamily)